MKPSDNKSEKYFAVSRAILEIIEEEGVEHLSHSKISRTSKVSRAWIYEYMGKEKTDLADIAAEIFASYFAKPDPTITVNTVLDLKKFLKDGQDLAFLKIKEEPVLIRLYFRFKGTPTPIGNSIKKYEKQWLDFMTAILMRVLKQDNEKASVIARVILTQRLGLYHRVATSQTPDKELALAQNELELIGQLI